MKTYILSDQMVRQLLANPALPTAIPELAVYIQQRTINQAAPRKRCGCGGRNSAELRVLGGVKEAVMRLSQEKLALAKQFMRVDGVLKVYYREGKKISLKVL